METRTNLGISLVYHYFSCHFPTISYFLPISSYFLLLPIFSYFVGKIGNNSKSCFSCYFLVLLCEIAVFFPSFFFYFSYFP